MAITDGGQICESTALTTTNRITLAGNVAAGGLMALGLGGRVASGFLDLVSVSDSKGNSWSHQKGSSGYRAAFVSWSRAVVPLQSGVDWIEVKWSKTPQVAWITGHVFLNASATKTSGGWTQGSPSSTASRTVTAAGTDDLLLAMVTYAYDVATTTAIGSAVEQDVFTGSNIFMEFLSRNYTGGPGSVSIGTAFSAARYWSCVAISVPFQAIPAPVTGRSMGLFGAV